MGTNAAIENSVEGDIVTVILFRVLGVLVDDVAVEVDTGEDTLVPRVGKETSVGEYGGGSLGVTADGARSDRDITAELDLVMQKTLSTIVCNGYEDEVCGLTADLKAEAGAGELNEGRSAPAMPGTAGDDALAIFTTDEEGTLLETGDDGNTGCVHGDAIGNAAIGSGHEFMQNFVGCLDTVIKLGVVGRVSVGTNEGGKQDEWQ